MNCQADKDMSLVASCETDSEIARRMMNVSRETIERLEILEAMLLRWQSIKNLVAPSTLPNLWTRHIADSKQIVDLAPDCLRWADFGSGAGFPGLVIAICLVDRAGAVVHLIESDHRKCAFLREAARETGAPVLVHNARVETVVDDLANIQIVTARALTALPDLLVLSMPLLKKGACGLFLKGQDVASELTGASIFSMVKLEFLPSRTNSSARIVRAIWAGDDTEVASQS
jgi:16S rRNA (guanine527-N7)-methyltransferase